MRRRPSVGIVGAGMSGLCQAILLRQAGITDVTVYEKSHDVGGTWRDNTYPGLSCDVPSRFYQFTFATNPGWSKFFSPGREIFDYFGWVTAEYGLRDAIRFGVEITGARFDGDRWRLTTAAGATVSHDFLISAAGVLREPRLPDIDGLADFAGPVMHSARWDHGADLTGKRVAVIGTGSTGVQIVCGLADTVSTLELFQRSAQWILPLPNPSYRRWTGALHRSIPVLDTLAYHGYHHAFEFFARALVRPGWRRTLIGNLCRINLRTVRDPGLRRRLTPDYQPMCRRLVISAGFYRAMQRRNVHLVDTGIDHVEAGGIVTADGALHELDAIVLATGFDAHAFMRPMTLAVRDGLTVEQLWEAGPIAHLGVALPGFPNFFMLMGPHSPVGNYSLTAIAEAQAGHILRWIQRWCDGDFDTVAPTRAATDEFNASMHDAMPDTVWATGCTSWYLGTDGLPELWPWTPNAYRRRLAAPPNPDHYDLGTTVKETTTRDAYHARAGGQE
ncbi:flavin-containing monooxygenase [Mycobacterium talmoniae]|uniref:Putative monooxygenase n=1 Tax=Mycobacterium talmoniae TaxID=1858794 RepID=A0A2S8BKS0_9MYCO|nr:MULTISPECIES: NAD(P)/FAD-dependent oxidoreductase [Mycobacterium]PQM47196.1 putative monooxygenase [Mycobacterium talmoniae]TDH48243.1 NAD(P)/FAD-dependent oxidoreductase [Mycobacterium eburneum]